MSSAKDSLRSTQKAHVIDAVCEGPIEGLVSGMKSVYLDGTPLQNEDGSTNFTDVTPPTVRTGTQAQSMIPWTKGVESLIPVGQEVVHDTPIERTITDPAADAVRVTMLFPQLLKQESDGDLKGVTVAYRIEVKGASSPGFGAQNLDFDWQDVPDGLVSDLATRVMGSVMGTASLQSGDDGNTQQSFLQATVSYQDTGTGAVTTVGTVSTMTNSSGTSGTDWAGPIGPVDVSLTPGATKQFSTTAGTLQLRQLVPVTEAIVKGKSSSAYQRSHLVRLPSGDAPWIVRVTRISDDATSTTTQNKSYWDSLTILYEERLSYPHTALVAFAFDAKQFNQIPQRAYRLKLLKIKVPSNYDPIRRAYDGDWDGTFKRVWSNNPVWCWYDLATNTRYGCGDYITEDMLDKWSLYEMARYCDEIVPDGYGGTEPRFTCNLYLQTREEAYRVLSNMAAIFRAMTFWGAGTLQLSQDRPRDPVYLFTNANVVDGQFGYQSSSIKTRHNVALVAWNDPNEQCRQRVEYVDDPELIVRWGFVNQTEVVALGCTSRGQAYRVGRWLLYTERYETESVVFETGLDGNIPSPGDVISIADQHRAGARIGGRLVDVPTSTTLVLDQAVTLAAGTNTIQVINDLGGVEERTITTAPGTTDTITVASAWDVPPSAQSIWMMSTAALVPELYRVISVAELGDGERFAITGVLYNPAKFAFVDAGAKLEFRDTSVLGDPLSVPPAPGGLVAADAIYVDAAKVVRSRITLSWQPVPGQRFVRGYLVSYRLADGGTWQEMQETSGTSVDILDVQDGQTYELQVVSVSQIGKRSPPAPLSYAPLGKSRPPADVSAMSASIDASAGVVALSWAPVADIDVTLYEVRLGADWESGAVIFSGLGTTASVPAIGAAMTFWVRAKDAERYSTNATSASIVVIVPAQPSVLAEVIDNNVLLRWTDTTRSLPVDYYEIRRGATFAGATVIGTKSGLFTVVFETQAGAYTYWVVGIDRAGNYGTPGSVPAQVSAPPDYVLQLSLAITWGALTNATTDTAGAVLPVNTTETWSTHFSSRSWTTPQDQITAGFPIYAEPASSSGSVVAVVDAGSTLPSSRITVSFSSVTITGDPTVTCTISVSNTSSTGPWTDFVGTQSVYATAFRWAKVTLAVTGGMVRVQNPSVKMEVKEKTDSGEISAVSTDSGGTTVTFVQSFSSVKSITLTPKGTAARIAIYDFAGGVNPTTFKVLLFDTTGARVSGLVSWKATGV